MLFRSKIDNKNFVESRPIKGTRSRDKDLNQDALNAIDLITNEKDRAENIMIVDLIRNDLSKVCETGSIMVPEILKLESFLKVHHLTSVIRGKLRAPFGGIIVNNNDNYIEAVLSTSPERFIKIDNKNFVESRPIKGTRSRDKDLNQDALNAIDLITNEKDRAENIMIVDLIRNDLSKVCETGSIIVPEILKLESFLKVHHLTSVIRGKLKKDKKIGRAHV